MNYQSRLLMLTIAQSMYAVGILLNYCRHIQSLKVRVIEELSPVRDHPSMNDSPHEWTHRSSSRRGSW